MPWTQEQSEAIQARNDTVLVSAAAGSGKTAVLVERVLRLLRDGYSLDRMLIVTFTRAAASEMRERIEKRLRKESGAHMRKQAVEARRARICTLHAFCQKLLKEHFAFAGIDPNFRLGQESELAPLRAQAAEEALNAAWESSTPEMQRLFRQFEYEELEQLLPEVDEFLSCADAHTDPILAAVRAGYGPVREELGRSARFTLLGADALLDRMEEVLQLPGTPQRYAVTLEEDRSLMEALHSGAVRPGSSLSFPKLKPGRTGPGDDPACSEQYKALREQWKKQVLKAAEFLPAGGDEVPEAFRASCDSAVALDQLTRDAQQRFFSLKQQKNLLDFKDLELLTARVLDNPDARAAIAGQFDFLFVDEYQDISGIQDSIIRALHLPGKNELFLVGDVKQSIYRFRLADPGLFMEKYRRFGRDVSATERVILLNRNFRSDAALLNGVNLIFRHAMREEETEIPYDGEARLRPSPSASAGDPPEIHIFGGESSEEDGDEGEAPRAFEREAAWIADRILTMTGSETLEESPGKRRRIRFRDIVILLRNVSGRSAQISRILERAGVPVFCDADGEYFQRGEVRDVLQLCSALCCPDDDITLLSVLRCPCFDFSPEELAMVRSGHPTGSYFRCFSLCAGEDTPLGQRCAAVEKQLDEWRFLSRTLPLDEFLWRLMEESGLYLRAGAGREGSERRAALRILVSLAQGDNAWMSLYDFVLNARNAARGGDRTSARELSEQDDVVRIMTLHKSKGLQFPVVFMMETAKAFRMDTVTLGKCHKELGLAVRVIDTDRRTVLPNPLSTALQERLHREQRAEECRLMYVGMTRAEHKLIVLGSPRDRDALIRHARNDAWHCGSASSMLAWIVDALGPDAFRQEGKYTAPGGEQFCIGLPPPHPLPPSDSFSDAADPLDQLPAPLPAPWVFPPDDRQHHPPLKASVSALLRAFRQEEDQEESPRDKRREWNEAMPSRPRFMTETASLTGSERGTLMHRALSLMDLKTVKDCGVPSALEALAEKGIVTEKEKHLLLSPGSLRPLEAFYLSPLGKRLLSSPTVRREWAFTVRLDSPRAEYLQGVIDLCFMEDGEWILCDYKTDRAEAPELKAHYSRQLMMYRDALQQITGIPVRECCLYSLWLNRALPLEAGAICT